MQQQCPGGIPAVGGGCNQREGKGCPKGRQWQDKDDPGQRFESTAGNWVPSGGHMGKVGLHKYYYNEYFYNNPPPRNQSELRNFSTFSPRSRESSGSAIMSLRTVFISARRRGSKRRQLSNAVMSRDDNLGLR